MKDRKELEQELHNYEGYVCETIAQFKKLYEEAIEEAYAMTQKVAAQKAVDLEFEREVCFAHGMKMGYLCALEKLRNQAEVFLIPLKEIGLKEPIPIA